MDGGVDDCRSDVADGVTWTQDLRRHEHVDASAGESVFDTVFDCASVATEPSSPGSIDRLYASVWSAEQEKLPTCGREDWTAPRALLARPSHAMALAALERAIETVRSQVNVIAEAAAALRAARPRRRRGRGREQRRRGGRRHVTARGRVAMRLERRT